MSQTICGVDLEGKKGGKIVDCLEQLKKIERERKPK